MRDTSRTRAVAEHFHKTPVAGLNTSRRLAPDLSSAALNNRTKQHDDLAPLAKYQHRTAWRGINKMTLPPSQQAAHL